jgi:hypothetical protein
MKLPTITPSTIVAVRITEHGLEYFPFRRWNAMSPEEQATVSLYGEYRHLERKMTREKKIRVSTDEIAGSLNATAGVGIPMNYKMCRVEKPDGEVTHLEFTWDEPVPASVTDQLRYGLTVLDDPDRQPIGETDRRLISTAITNAILKIQNGCKVP